MRYFLRYAALLLTLYVTCPAPAAENREWKKRELRGYGEVSAELDTGEDFSILEIHCESTAKASILHAKFLSDLASMGGVTRERRVLDNISIPVMAISGGGLVSAFRTRRSVVIVTGLNEAGWQQGAESRKKEIGKAEHDVQAEVPMYLDAWERYGFRFYYRPWERPGRDVKWADYPVLKEFDFAKKQSNCGFVFWAEASNVDNAVGLDNDNWWSWAERAAVRRKLPVVINTMTVNPTWFLNGHRDEGMALMPQFCGSYHGVASPSSAGMRSTSWCAKEAKEEQLAPLRRIVERYAERPQTIEYLEPHGELRHGDYDIFLEYGPVADTNFRDFLKDKYSRVSNVARRWKMEGQIRHWSDIRVPDLAEFLGYNESALDLTGEWRLGYEPLPGGAAEWSSPDYNDKDWPVIRAPGNQLMMFLDRKPAVFRRTFVVPAGWHATGERVWLYVWDLNSGEHLKEKITASLNGRVIGEDLTRHAASHWGAFETKGALHEGTNTVAIRVPQGFLGYHVYLSKDEPLQYPGLPDGRNAQWVDFADWRQASRLEAARRGLEAIRSVDPDRSIICMAPDSSIAGVKKLCEEYGARFHNTGHMGAFWNEFLPMLMRGADLPFSLEPGGPAKDLAGFKGMMGRYFTEGIQAIHYFIHIGSVYWNDEIRSHFEKIRPMLDTIGKVHPPKAEIAMLFSDRIDNLTGFPWGRNPDVNLPSGYFSWPLNSLFTGKYDFDGLTNLDFADGSADPYRIIIGANTSVMDEKLTGEIEEWVRRGGIFIAFVQTGRHTPETQDAWPISRLSGYKVTAISKTVFTPSEPYEVAEWWPFSFKPGQGVFKPEGWELKNMKANGLKLKPSAPDCEDLVMWEDGSTAIGMRRIGEGCVIHMGLKFCRVPLWHGWSDRTEKLFGELFEWAGAAPVPASAAGVKFRHYVSNNGLFDTWTLWNDKKDQSVDTDLIFRGNPAPAFCREVTSDTELELSIGAEGRSELCGIKLEPLETRIFITPRPGITNAAPEWFDLQCNWWRGVPDIRQKKPPRMSGIKALPETGEQAALDLTEDWRWKALDEKGGDDPAGLAEIAMDDSAWSLRRMDCWAVPEEIPSRRVFFRKTFKVPGSWKEGRIELWMKAWFSFTVAGKARIWLDGREVTQGDGGDGLILDSGFTAGSEHTLAVEVRGEGDVCGVRGNTWLAFTAAPEEQITLTGEWIPSGDYLHHGKPVALPGKFDARLLERSVELPDDLSGRRVYLHIKASHGITGCLLNGRYIRRHHHALGDITFLNVTPWINAGAVNQLGILAGGRGEIEQAAFWIY